MKRTLTLVVVVLTALAMALPAQAGNNRGGNGHSPIVPDHIWVDDVAYDTIIRGSLPWSPQNDHSFNELYPILLPDGTAAQPDPVAEYAPGDTEFRGGRWIPEPVRWTDEGIAAHDPLPVITSIDALHVHMGLGHIEFVINTGDPDADHRATDAAFMCPVLPNR